MRAAWLVVLAACEGGKSPPSDGTIADGSSACAQGQLIGELIDWDSSDADFLGVAGATVSQRADPSVTLTTPPNGRLELCPNAGVALDFDVGNPGDYLDGALSIERTALANPLSLRALTAARAASFYNEHGLIFDPNKVHLVVHQVADRQELSIDAVHDTAIAGNDDGGDSVVTWGPGNAGRYVLFPNIDETATSVAIAAPPSQPFRVRVVPGELAMAVRFFVLVGP